MDPKPVSASSVEFIRTMTQLDANLHGNVHGGVIMKEVDSAAGTAAIRHTGSKSIVTAAIDELSFLEPVYVGDILVVSAQVNYVGTTSMEVGVRVAAEDAATGTRRHTTSAYLVMVALDEHDQPMPVAPLELTTDLERRRFEQAKVRRQIRTERRDRLRAMREDPPPA